MKLVNDENFNIYNKVILLLVIHIENYFNQHTNHRHSIHYHHNIHLAKMTIVINIILYGQTLNHASLSVDHTIFMSQAEPVCCSLASYQLWSLDDPLSDCSLPVQQFFLAGSSFATGCVYHLIPGLGRLAEHVNVDGQPLTVGQITRFRNLINFFQFGKICRDNHIHYTSLYVCLSCDLLMSTCSCYPSFLTYIWEKLCPLYITYGSI